MQTCLSFTNKDSMDLHISTSPTADPRVAADASTEINSTTEEEPRIHNDVNQHNSRSSSNTAFPDQILEKAKEESPGSEQPIDSRSEEEKYPNGLVEFDGPNDPGNPKNLSATRKWAITASIGWMTFVITFASSIFSVATDAVSEEFGVARVVATLGVSLFLLVLPWPSTSCPHLLICFQGFVFGPLVFGPASEAYGRQPPLFIGYIIFGIFQIPVALGRNITTILIGRFLGGFAASAPLAILGGTMSDIWDPIPRAYAICICASAAFTGPVAGPVVGGFLVDGSPGWRWTAWLTLILTVVFSAMGLICIPETSPSRILQLRAARLRRYTGNPLLHAKADETPLTLSRFATVYLIRPFVMLYQEPILMLITAYMSVLYGILYLLFVAYPYSFHHLRGWPLRTSTLPFLSFIVGIIFGALTMAYSTRTHFTRAYHRQGRVVPEARLPPVILNAVILPIALFVFAWTSFPHITWVPQVIASGFLGMAMLVTFWQCINYVIDCYGFYSNSAISVNTFIRSIAGAVFPIFAWRMYEVMGVGGDEFVGWGLCDFCASAGCVLLLRGED